MKTNCWYERAEQVRKARGILKQDLADCVGKSPPTVSMWFSGKRRPALADLRKLAQCLGISLMELLEGDDSWADRDAQQAVLTALKTLPVEEQDELAPMIVALIEAAQRRRSRPPEDSG
jgi:transcriptional regulator with XRE-family HTH domain